VLAGEPRTPLPVIVPLDHDIGEDVGIAGGIEFAGRVRGEAPDVICGLGDSLDGGAEGARDLGMALAGQVFEMVADNPVFQGIGARRALELD
jgi:hypothetical protein